MSLPTLDEATFAELQDGLRAELFTSVDLVKVDVSAARDSQRIILTRAYYAGLPC